MKLTRKGVEAALPAKRSELLQHCPTPRHERRLDAILHTLQRLGLVELDNETIRSTMPTWKAEVA